jgi:NlpC/P60 family putative phage cell wall peptidase
MQQEHILRIAESWIGTPYRHQASLKGVGCDCLGLIRGVWRELYGSEPETVPGYSMGWAEAGAGEWLAQAAARHMTPIALEMAGAGDVLLFRWRPALPAKHAAIHAGDNRMIHAQDNAAVAAVTLDRFWTKRLAFAFRFPAVET